MPMVVTERERTTVKFGSFASGTNQPRPRPRPREISLTNWVSFWIVIIFISIGDQFCESEMEKGKVWVDGDEGGSSSPSPKNLIRSSVSEIIEEDEFDDHGRDDEIPRKIKEEYETTGDGVGEDCDDNYVYVAVGKSDSSMDALRWALKNALLKPFSSVSLIHVFSEVHYIPTPLGKFPKNQVSPEQLESYMSQESSKRSELLGKFLNLCYDSRVKVDTILIESDLTAKAVLDLIPILNIKKLVVGTNKSYLRKGKMKGIANVIQREAPELCEVRIICEGKDVSRQMMMTTTPTIASPSHSLRSSRPDQGGVNGRLDENEDTISRSPRHGSHSTNKTSNKSKGMDDSISPCTCFFSRFT